MTAIEKSLKFYSYQVSSCPLKLFTLISGMLPERQERGNLRIGIIFELTEVILVCKLGNTNLNIVLSCLLEKIA